MENAKVSFVLVARHLGKFIGTMRKGKKGRIHRNGTDEVVEIFILGVVQGCRDRFNADCGNLWDQCLSDMGNAKMDPHWNCCMKYLKVDRSAK